MKDISVTLKTELWETELESWKLSKYDGIKGFPPDWIPAPSKKKFSIASGIICIGVNQGKYNLQEIQMRFDNLMENKDYRLLLALAKNHKPYDEHLFYLVELYEASLLGEIEGLRILGGELAVMGKRKSTSSSKNARLPRPIMNYEDETLDAVIARLERRNQDYKPGELWVHLKTAIEEWSNGDCEEDGEDDKRTYWFDTKKGSRSITFGTFRKKLKNNSK